MRLACFDNTPVIFVCIYYFAFHFSYETWEVLTYWNIALFLEV